MKKKRKFDRRNSVRCKEYWMSRYNYTEEEAKAKISSLQSRGKEWFESKGKNWDDHIQKLKDSKNTKEFKEAQSKRMKATATLEYWVEKLGDVEGKKKYEKLKSSRSENGKRAIQSRVDKGMTRQATQRCVEYWLVRGYTEEEAKNKVSEFQSRGLEFFIDKYGKEEGTIRYNNRNKKWRESFISNNDMDEVNRKRSINGHCGYYTEKVIRSNNIEKLNFYVLSMIDDNDIEFIKFGLTKYEDIHSRWKRSLKYETLIFTEMDAIKALALENQIKRTIYDKDLQYMPSKIRTKEAVLIEEYELIKNIMEEHVE